MKDAADVDQRVHLHNVNQSIASTAPRSEPSHQFNLTTNADRGEYSADVAGEIARCISKYGFSVSSQRKRTLVLLGAAKLGWIQPIVGFRSKRKFRCPPTIRSPLQCQIKLRERLRAAPGR